MAENKHFLDDFENYEVTEDHHPSKFGYFLKWIFFIIIVIANGAIIFRVCMAEDPKSVKTLSINDELRRAYSESADDFTVFTQTVYDMYTSDGIYYSTGLFYIPAANQLQVAVRYNVRTADSAVIGTEGNDALVAQLDEIGFFPVSPLAGEVFRRYASENVSISSEDMRKGDFFTFRLTDDSGKYYTPTTSVKSTRILYVYHKLTFDGVPAEGTNLYVEIYPLTGGMPDYTNVLGRMKVYSIDRTAEEYSLSSSEKRALTDE